LASPANAQPLLVIGDVSALRVRAELDERDFGEIKIGQPVLVRAAAFRGRNFAGKVSFIAPLVEQVRINARGQRNVTDVEVVEVLIDLAQADPLAVGMKVDVYFQPDGRYQPAASSPSASRLTDVGAGHGQNAVVGIAGGHRCVR